MLCSSNTIFLLYTLLVHVTRAEVYTIDWTAALRTGAAVASPATADCNSGYADANRCNRFSNGGIGDTYVFTNVGSHDVTYFTCPAGVSEGSLGNDPLTGWACPADASDDGVYTQLAVVNDTATFTVADNFGGGARDADAAPNSNGRQPSLPGLCFFCSQGDHCAGGMKLTAVAVAVGEIAILLHPPISPD